MCVTEHMHDARMKLTVPQPAYMAFKCALRIACMTHRCASRSACVAHICKSQGPCMAH